jgi:DNA-binding beta-propeller fold protein YncE
MVMCVMLNPAKDTLYIADIRNYRIRAINMKSQTISTVAGNGKRGIPKDAAISTKAPLVDPRAAAADKKGNLYIVERGGHALRVVRTDGKIYTLAGTGKKGKADGSALKATMNGPKHLDIDDDGNVYIADDNNHLIRKYDPKSKTLTTVLGKGKTKLNRPHGVCVHKGYLYVADSWHHRILKIKL